MCKSIPFAVKGCRTEHQATKSGCQAVQTARMQLSKDLFLKAAPCLLAAMLWTSSAFGQAPAENSAAILQAKHTALATQLASNEFQRPLVIESTESDKSVSGSAYAVINYPFTTVATALKDADNW